MFYLEKIKKNYNKNNTIILVIFILICLIISRFTMFFLYKIFQNVFNSDKTFFEAISQWDCGWYKSIIYSGYSIEPSGHENGDAANWAFFPLMPMIIKCIVEITNLDVMVIAFYCNTLLFAIGLLVMCKYIIITRKNYTKEIIFLFIIFMTFGIYSFYFSTLYTEALYFCLLSCALYNLEKENYIIMGIFGALLSATRNVGILFCFVVLVNYIIKYINHKKYKNNIISFIINTLKNYKLIFGVSLIPMGLFIYMSYLNFLVGDPLAWIRIQKAWGRQSKNFLIVLLKGLITIERPQFFIAVLSILCFYLILQMILNKRFEEALIGIMNLIIPLSSMLDSTPRYEIGNIVFVLAFCEEIMFINKKSLRIFIILFICGLECILFLDWMQGKGYLI